MREVERVVSPYELDVTREDGRIVEVTIRAVGEGAELDHQQLRQAWRALGDRLRHDDHRTQNVVRHEASDALRALSAAWQRTQGEITDDYLAHLAVAYETVSALPGRGILDTLAGAIDRPMATVKAHVSRAREDGWLEPTSRGRSGGKATPRAREKVQELAS